MKRIIAILIAGVLLMGSSLSISEEFQVPSDFPQALMRWVQNLNLDESDYFASAGWENSPVYQATLRKNQSITELTVPDIGRAQISDNKVILDIGGQKYGIDLSMLMELIQSFSSDEKAALLDLEMLRPWLEKALTDIVLPSVRINYSNGGFSVHIDADDEQFKARTYALIDEIMAEKKTVETILSHYGPFLVQFFSGMPQTYDELRRIWEVEKAVQTLYWRDFSLEADITWFQRQDGLSASGHVKLYLEWLFGANLSFELKSTDEGIDFLASLDLTNYRDWIQSTSGKLEFHVAVDKMEGMLQLQDYSYMLTAERIKEEDGLCHYTVCLTGMETKWREMILKYDLDVIYDPGDKSLKAALYWTKNIASSDESREKLAALDVHKGILGWEAELTLPYDILSLNLNYGDQYWHLKLEHMGLRYYNYWYLDAWLYYSPDEYLIKAETNLLNLYDYNRGRNTYTYALALRKNELEYSVSNVHETKCLVKIAYNRTANGFEADVEYLNLLSANPAFNTWKKPSRLKLVRERNQYKADLEWSQESKTVLSATGMLDLDEFGAFSKLSIEATRYDLRDGMQNPNYHLTVIPETITYVDQSGIYELRIAENSADKMAITYTKDYKDELGSLILTLDDQGTFNGVLTVMGNEMANIIIKPIPKVPIDVINEENVLKFSLTNISEVWQPRDDNKMFSEAQQLLDSAEIMMGAMDPENAQYQAIRDATVLLQTLISEEEPNHSMLMSSMTTLMQAMAGIY